MNALMIGMNNIGVLAKNGHLSIDLVEDFCGVTSACLPAAGGA